MKPRVGQPLVQAALSSVAVALVTAGCSQKPAPEYSGAAARVVPVAVADKSVKAPVFKAPGVKTTRKLEGVPVAPKSLGFVQKGLHNCGTIAMLMSWTKLHPREAARMVRRENNGTYSVRFTGNYIERVTAADLKAARKVQVVKCNTNDRWAEIVLTAFAKLATRQRAAEGARSTTPLDFSTIEWLAASAIGQCLSGNDFKFFEIKPETQDKKGRIQVGAAVSEAVLERELKTMRGRPATAYTNRRIHIWAVFDYDTKRKRVYARNPRRAHGEWMSLSEFRERFQLLVYSDGSTSSRV